MGIIDDLIKEKGAIQLDIACGNNKQPGFIGMDVRPLPGVDIVHDVNVHPWPLPDDCALRAFAAHIVEHIPPVVLDTQGHTRFLFLEFMDEVWRVLKIGAEFAITTPHGASPWFLQDPTHINHLSEATWAYFDPSHFLYTMYRPKPWRTKFLNWSPAGNIEVILIKLALEDGNVPDAGS